MEVDVGAVAGEEMRVSTEQYLRIKGVSTGQRGIGIPRPRKRKTYPSMLMSFKSPPK